MQEPTAGSRALSALPWLITAGLVAFVLATMDVPGALRAAARTDATLFALAVCGGILTIWALDAWSTARIFARGGIGLPVRTMLHLRGATWVVSVAHGLSGDALFAFRIARLSGCTFVRAGGALTYIAFLDTYLLLALSTCGALLSGLRPPGLRALDTAFAVYMLVHLLYWRCGCNFILFGGLRSLEFLATFRSARLLDYARDVLLRLPLYLADCAALALLFKASHLAISPAAILAVAPLLTLVSYLPITVAGLGSFHVAARVLLAPNPQSAVDAFSTLYITGSVLFRLAVGLLLNTRPHDRSR